MCGQRNESPRIEEKGSPVVRTEFAVDVEGPLMGALPYTKEAEARLKSMAEKMQNILRDTARGYDVDVTVRPSFEWFVREEDERLVPFEESYRNPDRKTEDPAAQFLELLAKIGAARGDEDDFDSDDEDDDY